MLNHAQLLEKLELSTAQIFPIIHQEIELARTLWHIFRGNPHCQKQINGHLREQATWQGCIEYYSVVSHCSSYTIVSVDGSQIYPDRHQGIACYVINIGCVAFYYNSTSSVFFDSQPFIHAEQGDMLTTELVNALRTAYEFEMSIDWAIKHSADLLCFDGSLIFWHLDMHERKIKDDLVQRYITALEKLYHLKIPFIGYISLPKSKELVMLLRQLQELLQHDTLLQGELKYVHDAQVLEQTLQVGQRTNLFKHTSSIVEYYPAHLQPYFFYLRIDEEIVRIELPTWLCDRVDHITGIILDQVQKGLGYPICLAEAHEQAVVTNVDREFFYRLLAQKTYDQQGIYSFSQKSLKKKLRPV